MNKSHVNVWRHSLVLTRRSPAFYSLVEATCNRIKTIFLEFRITSKSNLTAKIVIFTLKMSKIANSRLRIMLNAKMLHSKMLHPKMMHSKLLQSTTLLSKMLHSKTVPYIEFWSKMTQNGQKLSSQKSQKDRNWPRKIFWEGCKVFPRCTDANSVSC